MEVPVAELELDLEPAEEGRGGPKDEPVLARLEVGGQLPDPAVSPGHALRDELLATVEPHGNALGRTAALCVENVGGERGGHGLREAGVRESCRGHRLSGESPQPP